MVPVSMQCLCSNVVLSHGLRVVMRCHCRDTGSLLWCCIPIIHGAVVMFPHHNVAPARRRGYHRSMMALLLYGIPVTIWNYPDKLDKGSLS